MEIAVTNQGSEHISWIQRLEGLSLGDAVKRLQQLQQSLPQCKFDWVSPEAGGT